MAMPEILVLNTGSSSLKFALHEEGGPEPSLRGQVRDLYGRARLIIGEEEEAFASDGLAGAVASVIARIGGTEPRIGAVAHRVVHGAGLRGPLFVDEAAQAQIEALVPLAPLHQSSALLAIEAARSALPDAIQIASFDTDFHAGMPDRAARLPLPRRFHEAGIRRYGFHGLSYRSVAERIWGPGTPGHARAVACHLGSGSSLCALVEGRSVETTMGLTALGGLPMATRTGDLDPGVVLHLLRQGGLPLSEAERLLSQESGLAGISGSTGDIGRLLHEPDEAAAQAVEVYCHRAAMGIAAMAVAAGGIDALVFTGGVGEHLPQVRERICSRLRPLGIVPGGKGGVPVLVLPSDEEGVLRADALTLLAHKGPRG